MTFQKTQNMQDFKFDQANYIFIWAVMLRVFKKKSDSFLKLIADKTNNSKDLANPTHLVYLGVTMIEVNLFYKVELWLKKTTIFLATSYLLVESNRDINIKKFMYQLAYFGIIVWKIKGKKYQSQFSTSKRWSVLLNSEKRHFK